MQCPKCQQPMETISYPAAEIDRCTGCQGMWFDMLEHEDLIKDAKTIDIGSDEVGRQHNANNVIPCPVCVNSTMIRMVDPQQPHLQFESCPVCFGRFFDAGEYRDLADRSFSDFVKRLQIKIKSR